MTQRPLALLLAVAVATSAVSTTLPRVAIAQSEDAITKQARARFQEGVDHFDKGRYDAARASFTQAYALKKHPSVLLNLAQSSLKGGHPLEAARTFQQYLREATTATPAQRESAETGLAEAAKKLGVLEVSAPQGSDVTVDGDRAGTAPLAEGVYVEPGAHTLVAGSDSQRVTVNAGQKLPVRFTSSEPAVVPAAAPVPAATTGDAEPSPSEPPPDAAPASKKTNLFAPPKSMTPVYVGLGVGAAGLVGAIVFGLSKSTAQGNADDVADQIRTTAVARGRSPSGVCSDPSAQTQFGTACQLLQDNNDKVDTNATLANVSLVVMAAGFVGAGLWYLAAPKQGEGEGDAGPEGKPTAARRTLKLAPLASPQGGGLLLGGTF